MTTPSIPLIALTVSFTAAFAGGCGRYEQVSWWEPTADVGAARTVAITDAYGRDEAVDVVAIQARDQVLAHGYFSAVDRQHRERLEVRRNGDVFLDTGAALQDHTVYVRVDVLEWSAITVDEHTELDDGTFETRSTTTARVLLALTAADQHGLLLDEQVHEAESVADGWADDGTVAAMLEDASAVALRAGLGELLPAKRDGRIQLDDRDSVLHDILDNHSERAALLETFVTEHPDHAGALYNRAVLKDAAGQHDAALRDYDAALEREPYDLFAESRAGCVERREAARALAR